MKHAPLQICSILHPPFYCHSCRNRGGVFVKRKQNKVREKTAPRLMYEEAREFFKSYKTNNTRKAYVNNYRKFINYCRNEHKCKTKKECKEYIQNYADFLIAKGYTASTVHSYLVPVCIYHNIPISDINKPKRITSEYSRGRSHNNRKKRPDNDVLNPKYERTVSFQNAVGIRRNELRNLSKEDWVYDETGYPCVYVRKGKGGKPQLQRILPGDVEFVKSYFSKLKANEFVFKADEFENNISYHTLRAKQAQRAYAYYLNKLEKDPEYRKQLELEILNRWQKYNIDNNTGKPRRFNKNNITGTYKLRGKSKEFAIKNNLPIEYDRLSLMAVSVFHLSHWRLSVTVASYMLAV